jgi:molybdate transport system substrate-binding protein
MLACLFCAVLAVAGVTLQSAAQTKQAPKELRIAAAADLQPVMPVLAAEYEKAAGVKLVVSFGSSATLAQQIVNGAPMDVFLAADYSFPEQVVAAGLAEAKAPTLYARGTLVLWARKDSPLQPITMDSLTDKRVTAIAIADALHAPYGRAAVSALTWMKLYDTLKPRLVVAENISQAAQVVESGNAQLGLISMTTASTEHFKQVGTFVLVPKYAYPELRQCGVVMAKSDRRDAANAFMKWLLSPEVQERLKGFGLAPAN